MNLWPQTRNAALIRNCALRHIHWWKRNDFSTLLNQRWWKLTYVFNDNFGWLQSNFAAIKCIDASEICITDIILTITGTKRKSLSLLNLMLKTPTRSHTECHFDITNTVWRPLCHFFKNKHISQQWLAVQSKDGKFMSPFKDCNLLSRWQIDKGNKQWW